MDGVWADVDVPEVTVKEVVDEVSDCLYSIDYSPEYVLKQGVLNGSGDCIAFPLREPGDVTAT